VRINPVDLKDFVENNPKLVKRRESKRWPGLYVLKYAANVFYDALWDGHEFIKYARGLVVDANYNTIVKPFTKVFNYGENGTTIDRDEECVVVRKVNGFMGVATYRPLVSNQIIYSTTGSLDSDYVDLIEKHVSQYEDYIKNNPNCSFIFEICDETDPHIIKEQLGAWLIGACVYSGSDNGVTETLESVLDHVATVMGCMRPESFYGIRFSDVVQMSKECNHEGYMVYGNNGTALKIKSPHYLTTKFLARCNSDKLLDRIAENKQSRKNIDEEYYPLLDAIIADINNFKALDEQGRISYVENFLSK
jgi:hypothetical protein